LPDIPGFHIQKKIGDGGMGDVYRAIDLKLARTVALKVMFPQGRDRGRPLVLFQREIHTLSQIEHPNVVPIYQAGEWRGLPFFTMKLVPGGSLAKHLERFTGNPKACAKLMVKVAHAMQTLHDHEVVHRDLKPLNILMGEGDEPLVADFGLAKCLEDQPDSGSDSNVLSHTGVPIGTRYYMSPEQTRGEKTALPKAIDIWAIGVTLYEMLAGKRPFRDTPDRELFQRICEDDPPALPDTVPAELEAIVLKCMVKNPADRYGSAVAVAEDLEKWLDDKPVSASLPRRPRTWLTVLGVLVLLALIVIPASLIPSGTPPHLSKTNTRLPASQRTIPELLIAGKTVDLIGADGLPLVETHLLPECEVGLIRGASGYTTLSTAQYSAVELSSEQLPCPVKLEAEYAIPLSNLPSSYAGVYVGGKITPTASGRPCQSVLHLIHQEQHLVCPFFDLQIPLVAERAAFWSAIWNPKPHGLHMPFDREITRMLKGSSQTDETLEWHKVEIVIAQDSVSGSWNGEKLPQVFGSFGQGRDKQLCMETRLNSRDRSLSLRPVFAPPYLGSGIGVCGFNVTAVFRNVRLIPLTP
jgi:serine/threonine protein kinase